MFSHTPIVVGQIACHTHIGIFSHAAFRTTHGFTRKTCTFSETTEGSPMDGGDDGAQDIPHCVYCCIPLQPTVGYANWPKTVVSSEGYHYNHSCERTS